MSDISIIGAAEGNLKNISLDIPRNKLVVFTGLSGSGKSTLLIDVLYNECQRQYLEAMAFQGIHKPKVERVRGASPAIVITQTDANRNPRSTVCLLYTSPVCPCGSASQCLRFYPYGRGEADSGGKRVYAFGAG